MSDEELCRALESKAGELVRRRDAEMRRDGDALARAQKEQESASGSQISWGGTAMGCLGIAGLGVVAACALGLAECTYGLFNGGYNRSGISAWGVYLALFAGIAFLVHSVRSRSRAKATKAGEENAGVDSDLARRRLEDARDLERRVKQATGALRAATSQDERDAARRALKRLEQEIDFELA